MVMGTFQGPPDGNPPLTVEEISLWMDGELDPERSERACEGLRDAASMAAWESYHLIGDLLRGCGDVTPGFAARFAARLGAEPTVLAPRRRPAPTAVAWAVAASMAA